jgi:putative FmdB family regulatory protein
MPIYGYRCGQCGHELEIFQSMSEPPLRVCPECSGTLTKMLYPVGVHFKGSGFYTTDYKNSGGGSSKEGDGESAKSEPAKTDSTKGEAAKSEPAKGESSKSEPGKGESSSGSSEKRSANVAGKE